MPNAAAALLEDRADVQLIVNDITLPGTMNGLKLAARAKAPRPEMNVIIVTGYAAPKRPHPDRAYSFQNHTMPEK